MTDKPKEVSREGHALAGGIPPTSPGACTATTQYGRPCHNPTQPGSTVCWSHDPGNAARRIRNARAGGRAAHSPTSLEIGELKELIREVKDGKVAPGVAAVITQLSNTIIRAIEQDRKVRELDEIEERLAELERRADDGHQRPAA